MFLEDSIISFLIELLPILYKCSARPNGPEKVGSNILPSQLFKVLSKLSEVSTGLPRLLTHLVKVPSKITSSNHFLFTWIIIVKRQFLGSRS